MLNNEFFKFLVLLFILIFTGPAAWSQTKSEEKLSSVSSQDKRVNETTLEKRLIQRNIEISEWFDSLTEGIDLFLVGEQVSDQKNQSRITVQNTTYSSESHSVRNYTTIGIYPRFHNLEKYWALKFTTYDEKEERRNESNNYYNPDSRRQNYGATVAWYRRFGRVKTSFEPRVELQNPVRISHSLTIESVGSFKKFEINPKLELYASAKRGPGIFQGLNWNFFLNRKWNLTLINEGDYLDRTRMYTASNGFSFGQIISRKSSMSYSLIFNSNNRPNYHLESYVASVSWSETVYKKVLDYSLTPYLEFGRGNHFRGTIGTVLNVRVSF